MSTHSQDGSARSSIMIRRRDKRRHLSSNAIDLRDPYSVIALAIRFDESLGEESLLCVPLETGRIYSQKSFSKALLNLQKKTAPTRKNTAKNSHSTKPAPLTPIILSGLLAAIQEQNEDKQNYSLTSTELVSFCRSMRRSALSRVRVRKQRRRIQRTVTPIIMVGGLILLYVWTMNNIKQILIEFGFVESCNTTICRLAEADLWAQMHLPPVVSICTMEACHMVDQELLPFYAMHTTVNFEWIPLEEIEGPEKRRRQPRRSDDYSSPLQWLGETTVNRLVREALLDAHPAPSTIKLLDVGCGVGGTLYAFLLSRIHKQQLYYHGISISGPEIHQAQRLLNLHKLESEKIVFESKNFDDPFDQTFSTMVAIESLSSSPDLSLTLRNLASALQSRGVLVIVDDVVAPWADKKTIESLRNVTARTSLVDHKEWKQRLESSGFVIKEVRDLGLEMDLPELLSTPGPNLRGLLDWRHSTAQMFLEMWSKWYGEGATLEQKASLRTIKLVQDFALKARAFALRQDAYRNADLGLLHVHLF